LIRLTDATAPEAAFVPPAQPELTLLCFSHLRWDFVFQRPQHLMSRFARTHRVVLWEEPEPAGEGVAPLLNMRTDPATGVVVATPLLPAGLDAAGQDRALRSLLDAFLANETRPLARWYYTPMMLSFSRHVDAVCTIYDCMDELANFRFAPPELLALEQELLEVADLVFTGGFSLYEAKKDRHGNVHPFPSSVDRVHFGKARGERADPAHQAALQRPRLGYCGVIDERLDLPLLAAIADAHPEWALVMVGPVVKIDPADLPRRPNLHYLGGKSYDELPAYLAGWDVALMPFAINEATRFISPTKTPEYLAGGKPVVSTAITDVVRHYGALEGVFIAGDAAQFIAGCEEALALSPGGGWLAEVDQLLVNHSWDLTHARMATLMSEVVAARAVVAPPSAREDLEGYDYVVVGAGFAGAVLAERLASQHDARILIIDRRSHVGGNAYDRRDAAGVLIHQYGPHIFHTNSDEVLAYLSRFTEWRPYEHRVLACVRDKLLPIPINRTTLNQLFGLDLATDEAAADFLASRAETVEEIRTSEDVVVAAVGRELYELFFQGYTRKQWGIDPSGLDKSVTARVPTRTGTDDRYFTDRHQCMPLKGYTAMFEAMLAHPNITRRLGTDWKDVKDRIGDAHVIFTGPVDEYFDFRFGKLPYRSLRFEHRTVALEQLQPVAVINYPDPYVPHTRITEYKHLTGQTHPVTSVTFEYPAAEGDPYYPIPRPENQALYKRYEALADATGGVTFVGRLATYRYYNMDQVVGQALATFRRLDARRRAEADQSAMALAE
jgi:UDP-galactopyranose mutase